MRPTLVRLAMPHPTPSQVCPKCSGNMEFGLLIDSSHGMNAEEYGSERAAQWVRGTPKRSWWSLAFKTAPGDRLQVATLRCTTCAFVELYAPSNPDDAR